MMGGGVMYCGECVSHSSSPLTTSQRSTFHAATPDIEGLGERAGVRAVSVGEKPYFDPQSISRRQEIAKGQMI